jgi:hypothetical protein
MQSQSVLLQIVLAGAASSRFASLLHSRQKQGNQHRDDRDDDEQLDQSKSQPTSALEHDLPFRKKENQSERRNSWLWMIEAFAAK